MVTVVNKRADETNNGSPFFYIGTVKTLAGSGREGFKDGKGSDARFNYPEGMAFDSVHRKLYVVEFVSWK